MGAKSAVATAICMLTAIMTACAGSRAADPGPEEVKVVVASVGLDRESGAHVVILADESGQRTLPIIIGDSEARAIMLELHGIEAERPLTHDLLRSIIQATGNHVDRVEITTLRNETYYALIDLDHGRYRIDSRPSDAIAVALGCHAPIYVSTKLFVPASAMARPPGVPRIAKAIGLTVQELTPPLAAALGEQPRSGVLVSAVDSEIASAGVKPGDVVTQLGAAPIRTVMDFETSAQKLKPGDSVALTLKRNGAPQSATIQVPAASGPR